MPTGGWGGFTSSNNYQAVAVCKVMKQFTDQGVEVWLRFAHEMNWYQYDGTYPGGVSDFQEGWATVAAACRVHAPLVKMYWTPNVSLIYVDFRIPIESKLTNLNQFRSIMLLLTLLTGQKRQEMLMLLVSIGIPLEEFLQECLHKNYKLSTIFTVSLVFLDLKKIAQIFTYSFHLSFFNCQDGSRRDRIRSRRFCIRSISLVKGNYFNQHCQQDEEYDRCFMVQLLQGIRFPSHWNLWN